MSVTWNHRTPAGTPIFAIDDKQRTIRGVLGRKFGAFVTVETSLGRGVTRRRIFHARFCWIDHWAALADLP